MRKPSKNFYLYILLTLTASVAIFFFLRAGHLQRQLDSYEQNSMTLETESFIQQLSSIDSLLINNDYAGALKAYEKLLQGANAKAFVNIIQQRIAQLKKAEREQMRQQATSTEELELSLLRKTELIDSLSRQLVTSGEKTVEKIDSLKFALAKANMRMESLSQQLTEKTENDYLKFNNDKGTEIYYVGGVKGKKANGWGVGLYSNGSRYEGEWESNLRHGTGVFFWPDGEYYSGEFVQDQRQGEGKYYWPNGEMFAGEWQDDKRNGEGVFYGKDGNVVAKGTWKNNELVKKE